MNLDSVLARLERVRHGGTGYIARCPAHEDRSPSLSIREGDGGRILLHCFAGCSFEAVCAALKMETREFFNKRGTSRERKPEVARRVEKQIADLRSRLTPRDRERPVTVVLCDPAAPDAGFARALALAVKGELVQVALDGDGQ
jgi:hypothetical protein